MAENNKSFVRTVWRVAVLGFLAAFVVFVLGVGELPPFVQILEGAKSLYYAGSDRYCPICDSHLSQFLTDGSPPRPNALCPVCSARERHRLDWLFIRDRTNLMDGKPKKLLHVAPEIGLSRRFREAPNIDYLSADLESPRAMVKMDITDIQYPDETFDIIYCSHVLEHVPDDRKAMRELYRVLRPGGWAILNVPVLQKTTFEDPSITTPEERERVYGQHDHVRIYGEDYVDRLAEAGFQVTAERFIEEFSEEEIERLGLPPADRYAALRYIYFCRK